MRVEVRTFRLGFSFPVVLGVLLILLAFGSAGAYGQQEHLLAYGSDLTCSYFIWEGPLPELKVVAWEKNSERTLLTQGDVLYLNKGEDYGLTSDQIFEVLEFGPRMSGFGSVVYRRGRVRIVAASAERTSALVEGVCGEIRLGQYLIPYIEKTDIAGEDLGYDVILDDVSGRKGRFLFLQDGYVQAGSGHQALIDLGREDGVAIGDQLIACRKAGKDVFLTAFANCVVIDVGTRTSTVKIISAKDAVTLDDWIVPHPKRRSGG